MQKLRRQAKKKATRPLVVPKEFDPAIHLDPEFRRYEDYARYVLDLIFWRQRNDKVNRDEFVPLMSSLMEAVFPEKCLSRAVLRSLERRGAIEIDDDYQKSLPGVPGRCMGYRMTEQLRAGSYRNVSIENKFLIRKLDKARKDRDRRLLPIHRHLHRALKLVEFDLDGARQAILDKHERNPWVTDRNGQERVRDVDEAIVIAERFADGGFAPIVDHYGRFHYGLSNLPSAARPFLTCKGQPLVFLDIACSQPFFLGLLYATHQKNLGSMSNWKMLRVKEDYLRYQIDEDFLGKFPQLPGLLSNPSGKLPQLPIILPGSPSFLRLHPQEARKPEEEKEAEGEMGNGGLYVPGFNDGIYITINEDNEFHQKTRHSVGNRQRDYLEDVSEGRFYEVLMADLGAQEDGREEFKKSLYRNVFYGPIGNQKTSREGRVMESLYPTIYALLLDLKQGQYKRPARLMQKLEAHFVYSRICSRIVEEEPHIMLGTVHDALVTTLDQADYVRRVMIEEFAKVGVTPTIRDK